MKVATWRGESRFSIDEVPDPVAGPGQVVVGIHTAGICGTDIHATQGLFPWTPPMVLGHEYTGVVREVGRGVSRSLVGRVVGFAERLALPVKCVHPLPKGLDPVTAALTEPAACCLAGLEAFRMPRAA